MHSALPDVTADKAQLVSRTGGSLLGDGGNVTARFCAHLDEVVASYVMQLPESETHPFLDRRRGAMRHARSWSSRVACGGEIPNHVHDGGWIAVFGATAWKAEAGSGSWNQAGSHLQLFLMKI